MNNIEKIVKILQFSKKNMLLNKYELKKLVTNYEKFENFIIENKLISKKNKISNKIKPEFLKTLINSYFSSEKLSNAKIEKTEDSKIIEKDKINEIDEEEKKEIIIPKEIESEVNIIEKNNNTEKEEFDNTETIDINIKNEEKIIIPEITNEKKSKIDIEEKKEIEIIEEVFDIKETEEENIAEQIDVINPEEKKPEEKNKEINLDEIWLIDNIEKIEKEKIEEVVNDEKRIDEQKFEETITKKENEENKEYEKKGDIRNEIIDNVFGENEEETIKENNPFEIEEIDFSVPEENENENNVEKTIEGKNKKTKLNLIYALYPGSIAIGWTIWYFLASILVK